MQKKYLTFFIIVIVGVLIFGNNVFAKNDEDRLNKIKQENAELSKQIKKTNQEKYKYQKEIDALDETLNQADREIAGVERDIFDIEKQIVKNKENLESAILELGEVDKLFKKRIRAMYKNGNVGYLDVLLSIKDSSDFLGNVEAIQKITENDKKLIEKVELKKKNIEDEKAKLEAQEILLANAKQDVEVKRSNLLVASRNKEERLKQIVADKNELQKMINANNAEAKALEQEIRNKQLSMAYAGGSMVWPLPGNYRISSPYGYRIHPILKTKQFHSGVDIPAKTGTKILAANDGVVIFSGVKSSYGNFVVIDHGGKMTTAYAHCSRRLVSQGQKVKKGQAIALVGTTGRSTGPHLHFEVRKDGKTTNPQAQFKKK